MKRLSGYHAHNLETCEKCKKLEENVVAVLCVHRRVKKNLAKRKELITVDLLKVSQYQPVTPTRQDCCTGSPQNQRNQNLSVFYFVMVH